MKIWSPCQSKCRKVSSLYTPDLDIESYERLSNSQLNYAVHRPPKQLLLSLRQDRECPMADIN